jgi:hypothetical protein
VNIVRRTAAAGFSRHGAFEELFPPEWREEMADVLVRSSLGQSARATAVAVRATGRASSSKRRVRPFRASTASRPTTSSCEGRHRVQTGSCIRGGGRIRAGCVCGA